MIKGETSEGKKLSDKLWQSMALLNLSIEAALGSNTEKENDAARFAELLDTNNRLEIIDYELRFIPHFIKMKELIETNQIGKIVSFDFEYLSNFVKDSKIKWDWSNNINLGGGYLNLVGGHFIDLANFLFGEYEKIIESEFCIYKAEREDYNGKLKKVTADGQAFLKI